MFQFRKEVAWISQSARPLLGASQHEDPDLCPPNDRRIIMGIPPEDVDPFYGEPAKMYRSRGGFHRGLGRTIWTLSQPEP